MISCIVDKELFYPEGSDFFSPEENYPEYPFTQVSQRLNLVYSSVRQTLMQAGLDAEHYNTPEWNPLGRWISPGQTVFVLCNFVYHRRPGESMEQFYSKCTHGSVIRAVIDYIFIAVGSSGRVRFGNAPVQSCIWSRVMSETGADKVEKFYKSANIPVESADLRLFIDECAGSLQKALVERRGETMGITIDLGKRSMLASLDNPDTKYRVSDYDPSRTDAFHQNNIHQYVLHRYILESDVIVSIPKLKTHEKVGITSAIKGCVGAIGHKDCLAHHRKGAPKLGGDEYRSDPLFLLASFTMFHDYVQRTNPEKAIGQRMRFLLSGIRFLIRRLAPTINGAWRGNDTCWRMAVDIARLIGHVKCDGTIQTELIRPHIAFLDAIIGGEGNGPLDSSPVKSGAVVFAENPVAMDNAAVRLLGYNTDDFSIVREAVGLTDLPLFKEGDFNPAERKGKPFAANIIVNGKEVPIGELGNYSSHRYRLSRGW